MVSLVWCWWWLCGCVGVIVSLWVPGVVSVVLMVLVLGLVMVSVPGWLVVMVSVRWLFLVLIVGLGHTVGSMRVVCVLVVLFWAVMMVGILRFWPQRLPLGAASTECGPSGRIVSKVVMGASGTVSNRE